MCQNFKLKWKMKKEKPQQTDIMNWNKKNKEKRLSSVQLLLLSSLLLLLSQSWVGWGGVEDVNNVKKRLVQYMHPTYILTVFFKLHCLVHRHYGFRCVCQLSRWNINRWRFKYCLLAFHLTCHLCIVWMLIYNNKNYRSPIWISSWNKMSS